MNKVQSALEEVQGVVSASVSMPDTAVVIVKSTVSAKDLVKAVKAAGYGASVEE
ncbi:MAG: cation transporter [Akkermansiaceae bacterium]